MNYFNTNSMSYPGYGGENDVRMSVLEYRDFVDTLFEDSLSKGMSFKFKKASMANGHYITGSLIMPAILGYGVARWVTSPFYVGIHRNKAVLPLMSVIFFWDFYRRLHRPLKRRLYTEMLTDETSDGKYIRNRLRK